MESADDHGLVRRTWQVGLRVGEPHQFVSVEWLGEHNPQRALEPSDAVTLVAVGVVSRFAARPKRREPSSTLARLRRALDGTR